MSKCSENVRTICGLAAAAAIIAACPARAEDTFCHDTDRRGHPAAPDLSANLAPVLGHVTSAANRVHFVMTAKERPGCPSRASACEADPIGRPDVVPGERVIISGLRDAFICATTVTYQGGKRPGWLPADAVASDKAEPIALADWLGRWHHSRDIYSGNDNKIQSYDGDITVKVGKAGALQIEGAARDTAALAAAINSEVTPAGDRLSFSSDSGGCKVLMQRLGSWLIVNDDKQCGGGDRQNATFDGVYTRVVADGVTPIGDFLTRQTQHSDGFHIDLWRTAETVVGVFYEVEEDLGHRGLIEQVSYDRKTGHLTFTAQIAIDAAPPINDIFTFDGRLAATELTGTLMHVDKNDPVNGSTWNERITLKKQRAKRPDDELEFYPSLADWRREKHRD
jgi:hypothetical protein